jgi:hypothetical protein
MKLKGLLVVLLILAILLPLSSIFQSASIPYASFAGSGQNVVVVAKEDYVFAKVVITVQPLASTPNVQVTGGSVLPAITFPNGTTRQVPADTTFVLTLPNTAVFPFLQGSASGPGYQVSPGTPVSVQLLSGQNSTLAIDNSIPGIHVFQYVLTGDATITVNVLGVSL